MSVMISPIIEPLLKYKIFPTQEDALRELLREYILGQISKLQNEIGQLTKKYGMDFLQFKAYLHERSKLLTDNSLSPHQRQVLGQAIMQEEEDCFDWKVAQEMLETWLGIRQEAIP